MKPKEAIILAGGLGTRLKGVTGDIPKPLAEIDKKPFLEYLLSYLEKFNIEHVILSVGYKSEIIQSVIGNQFGDIRISYAIEKEPLGTGGGIRLAMEKLNGNHAFILNGDTFFKVDLNDLSEFYFAHEADLCMTVKRMQNFFRYGTVKLNVCKVTGFEEKRPLKTGIINGGVYIAKRGLFDKFELPSAFSFEQDFLQQYINDLKICAMRCSDYFIDIGVPADFEVAQRELPVNFMN